MTPSRPRVITALCGVAALSLTLAGCAPAASNTGAVELYTWAAGSESQWDVFVASAQEQLGDDITLSYSGPSFGDYWTQIKTRYSGGDAPCLVATQSDKTSSISGLLAPLDDYLSTADISTSDFNAAMIDGMTVDGEVKALPYDASALVIYYNKALFAKHGVAEPTDTFTTAQFASAAGDLSKDGDLGFAYGNEWFWFGPFVIAAGHTWGTEDGGLDLTNDGVVGDLQAYLDLGTSGYATPLTSGTTGTQQDAFSQGNIGMIVGGTWDYSSLSEAIGVDNIGMAEIPSPDGEGPQFIAGSGYGISQSCADKDEAFTALAALVSAETQTTAATELGVVPSRVAVLDSVLADSADTYAATVGSSLPNGKVAPYVESWPQANALITQYLPEGFSGAMTAQELLEQVQASAR